MGYLPKEKSGAGMGLESKQWVDAGANQQTLLFRVGASLLSPQTDLQRWIKALKQNKTKIVRKMGNFVRLFCSMHTNIQAQILHSVEPTDQPVLVHIWMLCCKCHRGQGCGVSERHLL